MFSHMLTPFLVVPCFRRINEGIFYTCALPCSPGFSIVLVDIHVKEMSREMGVSKLNVKCLFSSALVRQNELEIDYSLDSDITM